MSAPHVLCPDSRANPAAALSLSSDAQGICRRCAIPPYAIPSWREHAPVHHSLAFIHDRSLRYGC